MRFVVFVLIIFAVLAFAANQVAQMCLAIQQTICLRDAMGRKSYLIAGPETFEPAERSPESRLVPHEATRDPETFTWPEEPQ